MAELKFRKANGELAEIAKVKMEAFRAGRQVRDAILYIPSRISHVLAAKADPDKIKEILEVELLKALSSLDQIGNTDFY